MKGIATSEPDLAQQTSGSRFLRGIIIRRWKNGHKKTRIRINNIPSEVRIRRGRGHFYAPPRQGEQQREEVETKPSKEEEEEDQRAKSKLV